MLAEFELAAARQPQNSTQKLERGVGGLTKDSRAMCEQIFSVEKSRLIEPVLGTIPSTLMTALVAALRKAVE